GLLVARGDSFLAFFYFFRGWHRPRQADIAIIRIIIAWERRASLGQHNAGFLRQLPHARGGAVNNIDGDEIATFRLGPSRNVVLTKTVLQNILHSGELRRENAGVLTHYRTHACSRAKVVRVLQLVQLTVANAAGIINGHVPVQVFRRGGEEGNARAREGDLRRRGQNPEAVRVAGLFRNTQHINDFWEFIS